MTTTLTANEIASENAYKFFYDLLTNTTLVQAYQQQIETYNGQENAAQSLSKWFTSQGYEGVTSTLAYQALQKIQSSSLLFWLGNYGQNILQVSSSDPAKNQYNLAISPNSENTGFVVTLNGTPLNNYQLTPSSNGANLQLAWTLDNNSTAGNLTFYFTPVINANPSPPQTYTGNWFQGYLQTSANSPSLEYSGGFAPQSTTPSTQANSSPSGDSSSSNTLEYVLYGIGYLLGAGLLIGGGYKLASWAIARNERLQAIAKVKRKWARTNQKYKSRGAVIEPEDADKIIYEVDGEDEPPEVFASFDADGNLAAPAGDGDGDAAGAGEDAAGEDIGDVIGEDVIESLIV